MLIQVIRIENRENGEGPYINGSGVTALHSSDYKRPNIGLDNIIQLNYGHRHLEPTCRYGFFDKEQYYDWFTKEEREALLEEDFVAIIYEGPEEFVDLYEKQVVFKASEFKAIGMLDEYDFIGN